MRGLGSSCQPPASQGPRNEDCVQLDKLGAPGMRQPGYLRGLDAGARVRSDMLWHFETLLEHSGDIAGMRGAALKMSGAQDPPMR